MDNNELRHFLKIESLGGFIWRMAHDLADGRVKSTPGIENDLVKMQKQIEGLVDEIVQFGVKEPRVDGAPTPAYRDWYRRCKDHWNSMSEKEQLEFSKSD